MFGIERREGYCLSESVNHATAGYRKRCYTTLRYKGDVALGEVIADLLREGGSDLKQIPARLGEISKIKFK